MIRVYVKKQGNFAVSTPKIKTALIELFTEEGIVSDADVSVTIVGEKKMLSIAKKYLREIGVLHNVLSFPFTDFGQSKINQTLHIEGKEIFVEPPDDILHLGEIVICFPKVVEESQKEGKLIDKKVIELVTHGGLHLLGKHHE